MARRIDSLKQNEKVTLQFHGSKTLGNEPYTLEAVFEGITGEGDERRANFDEVEAYRYNGHWAYGTSAEKLTLV
jgi:hypothetical protein